MGDAKGICDELKLKEIRRCERMFSCQTRTRRLRVAIGNSMDGPSGGGPERVATLLCALDSVEIRAEKTNGRLRSCPLETRL